MIQSLRPTLISALLLIALSPLAEAQMCGNASPSQMRGRGPSGPEGPGYQPAPPAAAASALQGERAPGFSADQSGRTAKTYFAVGNEPGWSAEVTMARPRSIRVQTDHGATTYEVSNVRTRSQSWSGNAVDGTAVRLTCGPEPCQDTMSGNVFPGTATLVVGKNTFRGCGGFRD